jgi:hypothetical protein
MQHTMERNCENSLKDFYKKPRIEWIQHGWPGQIVQVVDQIVWTSEIEKGLEEMSKGNNKEIPKYLDTMKADVIYKFKLCFS